MNLCDNDRHQNFQIKNKLCNLSNDPHSIHFNKDLYFKNSLGKTLTIVCSAEKRFVSIITALKVWSSAFNDGFGSAAHVNEGHHEGKQDSQSWQDHREQLVLVLHKLLFSFTFFTGIFFDFSFELSHFFHVSQTIICHYFDVYKHQVGFCTLMLKLFGKFWLLDARWRFSRE